MNAEKVALAVGWHRGERRAIVIPGKTESPTHWYSADGRFQGYVFDDAFANIKAWKPTWGEPRRVDQWFWLELSIFDKDGRLLREGRVHWNADGSGDYKISMNIGPYGFPCWPDFLVLSEAQAYIEQLIEKPLDEVKALNGSEWPSVVI